MGEFFEFLMLEAIRRDIHAKANRGIKKPFEVLVGVKIKGEGRGEVATLLVCNN